MPAYRTTDRGSPEGGGAGRAVNGARTPLRRTWDFFIILFNTGSIPVPIETFSNNGRIDHLLVINSLISQ